MSERYEMFKNFMHNELKITKQDIKDWTMESVKQVAENYVEHQMRSGLEAEIVNKSLSTNFGSEFKKQIKNVMAETLSSRIEVTLKTAKGNVIQKL